MILDYFVQLCITTSAKGAILIVFVLGVQKFFRKDFTSKWMYVLWSIVLIRLIVPFSPIKSVVSLFNLGILRRIQFTVKDVLLGRLVSEVDSFQFVNKTISTEGLINDVLTYDWFDVSKIVYILGIIVLLCLFIYINLNVIKIIKNSYKCTDESLLKILEKCKTKISLKKNVRLYITANLSTPMTYGVIKPKIIMPKRVLKDLNDESIKHIFLHELIHIKRNDVLFSNIGMIVCILHWFNPLVWMGFIRSRKDCELACDEAVLKTLTDKEYTQYGLTLIEMIEFSSHHCSINPMVSKTLIHDRTEANARVLHIATYTRKRKIVILISVIILMSIFLLSFNESSSIRPSLVCKEYDLQNYLDLSENSIRYNFGYNPKHSYAVTINKKPYFVLHYNVLGKNAQFWFEGTKTGKSRRVIEITTTSYKDIKQGMSIEKAKRIAQNQFISLEDIQEGDYLVKYIYKDEYCDVMIICYKNTSKVYSLTLF